MDGKLALVVAALGEGNLGRLGLTAASIGAVYSLTQAFIKANVDEPKARKTIISELASQQLAPVLEGDESAGALEASSPRPMMGAMMTVSPKPSSRSAKSTGNLVESIEVLVQMVRDDAKQNQSRPAVLAGALVACIVLKAVGEFGILRTTAHLDESVLSQNRTGFSRLLTLFVGFGIPVVLCQQLLHLVASNLSLQIRQGLLSLLMTRLVLSSHNLKHPEELIDQNRLEALMGDISTASNLGVQLGSDRLKRIIEIFIQFIFLSTSIGLKRCLVMLVFLFVTVRFSSKQKLFKSHFCKRVSDCEQALKKALSRMQRHRDDIALWNGAPVELQSVTRHVSRIEQAKLVRDKFEFLCGLVSALSSRVAGTALGLGLIASKFVSTDRPLFQYLLTARVMVQMASSASSLLEEEFILRLPKPSGASPEDLNPTTAAIVRFAASIRRLKASLIDLPKQLPPTDTLPFRVRKNNLCLNDVTGMSPDGSVLFQSLSLELSPGSVLLVRGPPGSGKSALLRIMAGTWPPVMGEVSRPRSSVLCVPSKPYLLLEGTLRDQVCYPDTGDAIDQEKLQTAIKATNIGHLFSVNGIARSGSGSALMGDADQQKLMLARLVYNKPKYALLDDCWKHLDKQYLGDVVKFLRTDLNCGVVLSTVEPGDSFSSTFNLDMELILSNSRQPPRHEIIVHRQPPQ